MILLLEPGTYRSRKFLFDIVVYRSMLFLLLPHQTVPSRFHKICVVGENMPAAVI